MTRSPHSWSFMNILILLRMLVCSASVSAELTRHGSTIRTLFWTLIALLALLPPSMLALQDGPLSEFLPALQIKPSLFVASVFFAGEVFSVFLMGWLIRQVASSLGYAVSAADGYLVAAIAAIPLWLSSLGLLANNPLLNTALPLSALASCCVLIYQGAHSLCHVGDRMKAAAVTQVVFGASLIVWALLLPLFWAITG